jgi:LysM repeat protein
MENIKRVNLAHCNPIKMKKISWLLVCLFTITVSAQDKLVIGGTAKNMYVVYVSKGTENLQTISNGFGISVTKLSSFNKTNIKPTAPLAKGTQVKIPITKNNLLQHPGENSGPVVHVVKKGENLYRVSQLYNKVPLASLREWNHLKKDAVKTGQQVIIGYMVNAKIPAEKTADKKTDTKKEIAPATGSTALVTATVTEKKATEKKEPAVIYPPVTPDTRTAEVKKTAADTKKQPVELSGEYVPKEGDEGFFASGYAEHTKEQKQQFRSGDASIFKTISGWTDRKFYVLMNDVAPKTIVRITGQYNKSICAMVLGPLQETKGATGLLLRVSNSAASALGIADAKFTVTVTYFE